MIVNNTPLETHMLNGVPILVKREDLCCPFPGPSFSKIRGVVAHIKNRTESVIGVLDTYHSKAGWAVAYVCLELGKQCVDFWPRFKADNYTGGPAPRFQQQQAAELGATLVDLQAGRSAILYHTAKKHLRENYPDSYLMPNALKLPESITENAAEAVRTAPHLPGSGTLVISISSGTVAAGVLLGFAQARLLDNYNVILHMGYSRSQDATREYIEKAAGLTLGDRIKFIDEGYGYADAAPKNAQAPFPCNKFYDLKAYHWLSTLEPEELIGRGPVVFWNIGDD
jgi:1-aminocyclopropane-1-carboxylate deaminase/D-cysteine desulfhydrase-like pyridoxal-dependent ACC family enzyme